MKRPYRDVLVWLAGIRPPNHDLAAERAIAAVIAMLAAYDRDQRLAARWGGTVPLVGCLLTNELRSDIGSDIMDPIDPPISQFSTSAELSGV